jgi:D-alanine-D-alanine ligase
MSARASGVSYEDLCLEIVRSASLDLQPAAGYKPSMANKSE